MKDIIIRNENASHRFIRNYMAAHDIADLNSLKYEGINHGPRPACRRVEVFNQQAAVSRVRGDLNAIPVDLRGDKPSQPASDRLTFQPFSTLALV